MYVKNDKAKGENPTTSEVCDQLILESIKSRINILVSNVLGQFGLIS